MTAFKRTAEIIRDYVHKGSKLYIEGKLQTQSWEKDGVKHYKTVILVNDLGLLDGKPDANAAANGYPQGKTVYQKPTETEIDNSDDPILIHNRRRSVAEESCQIAMQTYLKLSKSFSWIESSRQLRQSAHHGDATINYKAAHPAPKNVAEAEKAIERASKVVQDWQKKLEALRVKRGDEVDAAFNAAKDRVLFGTQTRPAPSSMPV